MRIYHWAPILLLAFPACREGEGQTHSGQPESSSQAGQGRSPLENGIIRSLEGHHLDPKAASALIKTEIAKANSTDPFLAKAYYMAAVQESYAGDFTSTISDCDRALSLPVTAEFIHVAAANLRIRCYTYTGDDKAILDAAPALIRLPDEKVNTPIINSAQRYKYEALARLAAKSHSVKDIASAQQAFEDVIKRQDGKSDEMSINEYRAAIFNEFTFLHSQGQNAKAVTVMGDFLKRHPKDSYAASYALEMVLVDKKTTLQEVRPEDVNWIQATHPCHTNSGIRVLYQIAFSFFRWGHPEMAIKMLEDVCAYKPGTDKAGYIEEMPALGAKLLVSCYDDMEQRTKAIEAAKRVIKLYPGTEEARECALQLKVWGADKDQQTSKLSSVFRGVLEFVIAALIIVAAYMMVRRKK